MNHRYFAIVLTIVLSMILLASSLTSQSDVFSIAEAQSSKANWDHVNGNHWAQNWSPQTEISPSNAHLLELNWLFPFPHSSVAGDRLIGAGAQEGSIAPPLVVDGTMYVATNWRDIYAFDLETGDLLWINEFTYDITSAQAKNPAFGGLTLGHIHGLNYDNGLLWTSNLYCTVRAVDAKTGETRFMTEDQCLDIPGNSGYDWRHSGGYTGVGKCNIASHPGSVYRKENIMIQGFCGADLNWGGRMFMRGYDMDYNPPKEVWTTFMQPPAEGDPDWALRNCAKGWFFSYPAFVEEGRTGIPCSEVPEENLINDWGVPKHWSSAVSAQWGQQAIDEELGIVYFGTGNQGGWANQTWIPGPNLYAGSIVALDAKTGEMVWWYQHVVRDMVEGDSSWNTVMAEIPWNGMQKKVLIKLSTTGIIWMHDAATGEALWVFEAPHLKSRIDSDGVRRGRTGCVPEIGGEPRTQDGYWNDPMDHWDMQGKSWLNEPSTDFFCWMPVRAGESDVAFDPERNLVIAAISDGWGSKNAVGPFCGIGCRAAISGDYASTAMNTTIHAIDASTGDTKWSFFIDKVAFRGGVIVSNGVVFAPAADGFVYVLNADTGTLIDKLNVGVALGAQPTLGTTSSGRAVLIQTNGVGFVGGGLGGLGAAASGSIMIYGLPDIMPEPEIIIERVEVEKIVEVEKEVEVERIVEVEKEVPVEVEVERISPLSYVIIGLGVILIVVSGVLYQRNKQ